MAVGNNDNVIETDVVRVVPDLKGFREKLKADLEKATKGVTASVQLKADTTGFARSAREVLAKVNMPKAKVRLVADSSGFRASARAALATINTADRKIRLVADFDAKDLKAKVEAAVAGAAGSKISIGVEADPEHMVASVKLALAKGEPYKVKVKVDIDRKGLDEILGGGRGGGGRGGGLGGLGGLLAPPQLLNFGGEGVRPMNLLIAAAAALSPLLVSVASSATLAASSIAALGAAGIGAGAALTGVIIGFQGVLAALKMRQTVLAQEATAAANVNKTQQTQLKNQNAINKARKKAIADLVAMRQKIVDLRNEEKSNVLSVAETKDNAATVSRNFFASALEKARANQDVNDAVTKLSDTRLEKRQTQSKLTSAVKAGVNNSDAVIAAQATALPKITSPAAQLAQMLAKLSPAARDMYNILDKNRPVFDRLSRSIQQKVLPGFNKFLRAILKVGKDGKSTLSIFADAAGDMGKVVGDLVARIGKILQSKWFRRDFQKIIKINKKAMKEFGGSILDLIKPFMTIFRDSAPLLTRFSGWFKTVVDHFSTFITDADKTGKLKTFFTKAGDELKRWAGLAKEVLRFLLGIFSAAAPSGSTIMDKLTTFFKTAADWATSKKGQKSIRDFFGKLSHIKFGKIRDFVVQLGLMFIALKTAKFIAANPFFTALTVFAVTHPEDAIKFMKATTKFIIDTLGWIEKHPTQAAVLLAIFTAMKLLKGLGLIRVAIGGLAAIPAAVTIPALIVTGGVTAAALAVGQILGDPMEGFRGLKALVSGPEAYGEWSKKNAPAFRRFFSMTLPGWITFGGTRGWASFKDAFINTFGGPALHFFSQTLPNALNLGAGQGGWAGLMNNLGRFFAHTLPDTLNLGEGSGWAALGRNLRNWFAHTLPEALTGGGSGGWSGFGQYVKETLKEQLGINAVVGAWEGISAKATWLWGKLTGWYHGVVDWVKNLFGIHSPSTVFAEIGGNLIAGLWQGFTTMWTSVLGNVLAWIDTNVSTPLETAFSKIGTAMKDAFISPFTGLVTLLAKPVKTAFDWIDKNLIGKLNTLLSAIGVPIIPPIGFVAPTSDNPTTGPVVIPRLIHRATGGMVPGHSPNKRADNIPAMLTANEYVQPVDAVQHYGVDFMNAIRDREYPRFAAGGLVGGLEKSQGSNLATKIITGALKSVSGMTLKTLASTVAASFAGAGAGGSAVGDSAVAETAESVARSMGASEKQLVALIEAGIVESGMRNINYGDRDSLGFLQQRAGWGSAAQRMNVAYATRKFIDKAKAVDKPGYDAGQLAQAVQVSAYPLRYGQHLADAVATINRQAPFMSGYTGGAFGTGGGGMGYQWQESVLKAAFGDGVQFFSTTGGKHANNSYHYKGRAVDLTPSMEIFNWIKSHYGANTKELIYGPAGIGIKNGQPYNYGATLNSQHNNHVHWAFANGGLVPQMPMRKYDTGGGLPPGYTMAFNGTGKTETVRTAGQEAALGQPMRLDKRDLALLAQYISGATSPTVHMDGRKVAEVTNRYAYLPAGV